MLAASYLKANVQAKQDFQYVFERYLSFIKEKRYKNVLDVGCGPGNIISESLLPALSKSCKKIIGVDVSKDMVSYAKAHNQTDPRIDFFELDITTNMLPEAVKNEFDFITSFYCFHFVTDYKKACQNIYEMLKPGGELLISFMCRAYWFDGHKHLKDPEQFEYLIKAIKENVTPTFNCSKEDFERNLLEVGFEINDCCVEDKNYVYDKDTYIDAMELSITLNSPSPLTKKLISALLGRMKANNLISVDQGKEYVNFPYSLLTVYARKPL